MDYGRYQRNNPFYMHAHDSAGGLLQQFCRVTKKDAIWTIQCSRNFLKVYDIYFLDTIEQILKVFMDYKTIKFA